MADVIQIRPEDYRSESEPEQAAQAPSGAPGGVAPPDVAGAAPNPATGALASPLGLIPRWVWVAAGSVAFLALVYVLQRQFKAGAAPRRRRNPRGKAGGGIERARRQRMQVERSEED